MITDRKKAIEGQVDQSLPDLFKGPYRSALYIGANHIRQHFLQYFVDGYENITVLEIHPGNVEYLKGKYTKSNTKLVEGDVRDVDKLVSDRFDVCFFWHGPEHLDKNEVEPVLKKLESLTEHLMVLGMPYGRREQGAEYGNEHEIHKWYVYPADMKELGYEVSTVGDVDDPRANMMAWKHL